MLSKVKNVRNTFIGWSYKGKHLTRCLNMENDCSLVVINEIDIFKITGAIFTIATMIRGFKFYYHYF